MTPEERTLVEYRLERAREAIEETTLLFETGHLHTYVNRLYYACFNRQKGDYLDLVVFRAEQVEEWQRQTEHFVGCMADLVSR